jgi:DNA polymerase-3 subunit alpha
VQRYGQAQQEALVAATADLAGELGCRWWPRTRSSFSNATTSRRTRRASASPKATCSATRGARILYTEEQYFKSADEMVELFADLPEALANSVEIAKRCNLQITLGKSYLPDFPTRRA